ncbi:MAG: BlaI/MecI/CopY family transcriptional regulator [Muribaculaceae bacterium]|nr:BlaI/MecI/CopY family transcriptional regulator [Muribaculaceae bacterium]MDE7111803.1 BlaI/MecI/CopY family transcriptional regulator [Muribaculaceae bacterium]
MNNYIQLTEREEELMRLFWQHGPMFVRELHALLPEPRPHVNTIATFVRILEQKGMLAHESFGHNHRFYPVVSAAEHSRSALRSVVDRYFDNSLRGAISALISEERLTDEEVRELIEMVQRPNDKD